MNQNKYFSKGVMSMRLEGTTSVFNVSDTNGRRDDIIDAYKIYLDILYELQSTKTFKWSAYPNSFNQFTFYQRALELSKGIFNEHKPYDNLLDILKIREYEEAFKNQMGKKEFKNLPKGEKLLKLLDEGAEKRARHYTNTLVKIGFCDPNRVISNVGMTFLKEEKLFRNEFEYLLPINDINLILLRQSLKLKVYTHDYKKSYSPVMLLLYILYKIDGSCDSKKVFEILNTISPYRPMKLNEVIELVKDGSNTSFKDTYNNKFIEININNNSLFSKDYLAILLRSNKSNSEFDQELYYDFYIKLHSLVNLKTTEAYNELKELFLDKTKNEKLKNTFGAGKIFLNTNSKNVSDFFEANMDNKLLDIDNFNLNFYKQYKFSKRDKDVHDYNDMLKRVARATGIIHISNNHLNLDNKKIWSEYLEKVNFEELIFKEEDPEQALLHDTNINSQFYNHIDLSSILNLSELETQATVDVIRHSYNVNNSNDVKSELIDNKNKQLIKLINNKFNKEKVIRILSLFESRNNDKEIHELVGSDANIPTIYEYMIGIAWYHLSEESYDVFSSFNLTMNANFLPETHAGGGVGDIVVKYKEHTVLLEVTLMNKNAQKRGEWEPVLRHATNLTIDESPRKVRTLFIADELDPNTINIWRAVASTPMMATTGSKKYADSVVIMPFKTSELIKIMNNQITENKLFELIDGSYASLQSEFDLEWREKIIKGL